MGKRRQGDVWRVVEAGARGMRPITLNGEAYYLEVPQLVLTPDQAAHARFPVLRRGLDALSVAQYMAHVAAELERRDTYIARLTDELNVIKQGLREWQTQQARVPYVGPVDSSS